MILCSLIRSLLVKRGTSSLNERFYWSLQNRSLIFPIQPSSDAQHYSENQALCTSLSLCSNHVCHKLTHHMFCISFVCIMSFAWCFVNIQAMFVQRQKDLTVNNERSKKLCMLSEIFETAVTIVHYKRSQSWMIIWVAIPVNDHPFEWYYPSLLWAFSSITF